MQPRDGAGRDVLRGAGLPREGGPRAAARAGAARGAPDNLPVRAALGVRLLLRRVLGFALGPHLVFLALARLLLEDHRALRLDARALPDRGIGVIEVDALAGAPLEPVHG